MGVEARFRATEQRIAVANLAPGMLQAFVRTDVVAGGLLTLGQIVELQWHLPRRASDAPAA